MKMKKKPFISRKDHGQKSGAQQAAKTVHKFLRRSKTRVGDRDDTRPRSLVQAIRAAERGRGTIKSRMRKKGG